MKLDKDELGPDIRSFLKDFLPQLKDANDELESQPRSRNSSGDARYFLSLFTGTYTILVN
jgi:hypothetical protein